jgi:Protein of unknown function (DUF2630)
VDEQGIFARIDSLISEEHDLRRRHQSGQIDSDEEKARLARLEVALDQCWDLLRRRRALREFGQSPDSAKAGDATQVEGYLQ